MLKKLVGCTRRRRAMARGFLGAGGQNVTSTSGILCSLDLGVSQPDSTRESASKSSPVKDMSRVNVFGKTSFAPASLCCCVVQELPEEDTCCDDDVVVLDVRTGRRIGRHTQLSSDRRRLPDPTSGGSCSDCCDVCNIGQQPATTTDVGAIARMRPLPYLKPKKKNVPKTGTHLRKSAVKHYLPPPPPQIFHTTNTLLPPENSALLVSVDRASRINTSTFKSLTL